jgi:hypothetical protein
MPIATDEHSGSFEATRRRAWWVGALVWAGGLAAVLVALFLAAPG